jgi:hypothetical protein
MILPDRCTRSSLPDHHPTHDLADSPTDAVVDVGAFVSVASPCAAEPVVTRSSALSTLTRSRELGADAAAVKRTEGRSSVTEGD